MDYSKIIHRVKSISAVKTDSELAEIFGISQQNFSLRKKRETLLPLIVQWSIDNRVDLNWLLTGESVDPHEWIEGDSDARSALKISDLLTEAAKVLERRDDLSKALSMCIRAHYITSSKA